MEHGANGATRLDEEQFQRLRDDLVQAVRPHRDLPYFGQLLSDWVAWISPQRVNPDNERRLVGHLALLAFETEETLTAGLIEDHLLGLRTGMGLAPSTVNKIHGAGRLVVSRAQAVGAWGAVNPFTLVRRQREPQKEYELLTLDEFARIQAKLRPDRRRQFRVALHLGLRPGELLGLRKEDLDLRAGSITIRRSHGRDSTKTGRDRLLPLLPAIAGDLAEACALSPSELVFGREDGSRQREDTKLTRVIRTAMATAGVGVIEVTYKCRRCKEAKTFPGPRIANVCTTCGVLTWPVPRVRDFRWYDLRHACATLHRRAGADPLAIAVALGHTVKGTTESVYTHLEISDLHRELSKWSLPLR